MLVKQALFSLRPASLNRAVFKRNIDWKAKGLDQKTGQSKFQNRRFSAGWKQYLLFHINMYAKKPLRKWCKEKTENLEKSKRKTDGF